MGRGGGRNRLLLRRSISGPLIVDGNQSVVGPFEQASEQRKAPASSTDETIEAEVAPRRWVEPGL